MKTLDDRADDTVHAAMSHVQADTSPTNLATSEEIERARCLYAYGSDDNIEIDDGAPASRADEGVWVQAWVWLPNDEDEDEE